MIKTVVFMTRRADVAPDVFKRHYEHFHAPVSQQYLKLPGYARNHVLEVPETPRPDFDVMTAFWYHDQDHIRRTLGLLKTDYRFLPEDGDLFIDRSRTWSLFVEESAGPIPGQDALVPDTVKFVALLKRKSGITKADFEDHYESTHAPLILKLTGGIQRYVRNYTRPGPDGAEPPLDSVTEIWYRDMAAFKESMATWASEAGKAIRKDENSFLDRSSLIFFLAEECIGPFFD